VQVLAGFNVPLTPRWELAFDYRYWQASSIELNNVDGEALDVKHRLHIGQAHLRYFFGDERTRTTSTLKPRTSGWYLTGSLGGGYAVDSDLRGTLDNLDAFKTGPLWSLALGYGLTPHWRLELEASERTNDVEVVDFSPINGQFPASGDVKASSLMVNAIYRFRPDKPIRPILGFGAGTARVDYDVATLGEVYLDEKISAPALQIIAGFEIALTEQLDFTSDYRSWYTAWLETEREGEKVELTHWVHSVAFGLRYSF
jgi:opacity protein-like surface antigen